MRRVVTLLALLLACCALAFGQYSYASTSIYQANGTVYASTYAETDYNTAQYYSFGLWSELDQCNYSDCYLNTRQASGYASGDTSASWSGSVPLQQTYFTIWAEPYAVASYYYYDQYGCGCNVYEDEYGYSQIGGAEGTPDCYETAPSIYEEIYTDTVYLESAWSVLDATTNPPYIAALQEWPGDEPSPLGDPEPGGSGYLVLYGTDLSDAWGDTVVTADAGVSTSVSYASPSQVNVYYTIDSNASPGDSNVWLSTPFGASWASFTINPPAATLLSNGSLDEATTDWTDLGNGTFDVTVSGPAYDILDEYGFLQSSSGVLNFPVCTLSDPRLCIAYDTALVLIRLGALAAADIEGLRYIWSQRVRCPYGWPGDDGTVAPSPDWTWKGTGPPGSDEGNWTKTNPDGTTESLHPDLGHGPPEGPHWDYKDKNKKWWRVWKDGTMTPKP